MLHNYVSHNSLIRPWTQTHQAVLKPLLYVGSCWARDLAQEGFSLLRKGQHLQGQSQVLDEMEHWYGVHAGGWRRQPRLTGTITNICNCFSAWNRKEEVTLVRRVDVTVSELIKSKDSEK